MLFTQKVKKNNLIFSSVTVLFLIIFFNLFFSHTEKVLAQDLPTATVEPTAEISTPTEEPSPTQNPTITPTSVISRPIIVIKSYSTNNDSISPGKSFTANIVLINQGADTARNILISFPPSDFIPRSSGGVITISSMASGEQFSISQKLTASDSVAGKTIAYMGVGIVYSNNNGVNYSTDTTLSFNLLSSTPTPSSSFGGGNPSPTSTTSSRPQLIITNYSASIDPLQPGSKFTLNLLVKNLGTTEAKNITFIIGGGNSNQGSSGSLTTNPPSGGVSGSSGDFQNFAPLGTSNIQIIQSLSPGSSIEIKQDLVVNVSTNPGIYPLKISAIFSDRNQTNWQDDQVVTLLVFRLPQLEVSYYTPVQAVPLNLPSTLPIQVVNIGKYNTILGKLEINSDKGQMENNIGFVGQLEPGGYYPLDVIFTPNTDGDNVVSIKVTFTDDFGQQRALDFTLPIAVIANDMSSLAPTDPGSEVIAKPEEFEENFFQKLIRILKELFGIGL
jgi:hypothetical protein